MCKEQSLFRLRILLCVYGAPILKEIYIDSLLHLFYV